ncbi:MAG: DinB family protein [Pseudomonadota bacterium]
MISVFSKCARNNAWANNRLHDAVALLPDDEFRKERDAFFPSIRETLNHILEVDHYYIDAVYGNTRPYSAIGPIDHQNLSDLSKEQYVSDDRLVDFCDNADDETLLQKVKTDRGERGVVEETVADLLMHLFQHQVHHRGQVHNMLSQTDVKPPQLDDFFLEFERDPDAALRLQTFRI